MPLNNVDLYRIDGNVGSVSNIQTAAINGGPIGGTRNRIINGDMRIDQRNNGASVSLPAGASQAFITDRWWGQRFGGTAALSGQRSTVAPTGFTNSLLVTTTTAASPSAGDTSFIAQRIEGFNVADLGWGAAAPQVVTLSFWVRSSLTGTFSGSLNANVSARSYVFTYTISTANTWEQKAITVPGDTTGTWLSDTGWGIQVGFDLGCGTTVRGSAGSWSSGQLSGATGSAILAATSGATFYITGVQLEPGTVATPFERRSYGQELALCQRYYYNHAQVFSTNTINTCGYFPVTMRATPTLVVSLDSGSGLPAFSHIGLVAGGYSNGTYQTTSTAGTGTAKIAASAEL
jgi:hypothetical protein